MREGRAGPNTTETDITVLDAALAQIPAALQRVLPVLTGPHWETA